MTLCGLAAVSKGLDFKHLRSCRMSRARVPVPRVDVVSSPQLCIHTLLVSVIAVVHNDSEAWFSELVTSHFISHSRTQETKY